MKIIFILLIFFMSVPVTAADKSIDSAEKKRKLEALSKIDILECLDKGGVIKSVCMDCTPYCVKQYTDAGKKCNDSSECLGKCRIEDDFVPEGTITTGFCTAKNAPCGCSQLIVNGKVEQAMCYD